MIHAQDILSLTVKSATLFDAGDLVGFDDAKVTTADAPVKGVARHPATEIGQSLAVIVIGTAQPLAAAAITAGQRLVSAAGGGVRPAGASPANVIGTALIDAALGQRVTMMLRDPGQVSPMADASFSAVVPGPIAMAIAVPAGATLNSRAATWTPSGGAPAAIVLGGTLAAPTYTASGDGTITLTIGWTDASGVARTTVIGQSIAAAVVVTPIYGAMTNAMYTVSPGAPGVYSVDVTGLPSGSPTVLQRSSSTDGGATWGAWIDHDSTAPLIEANDVTGVPGGLRKVRLRAGDGTSWGDPSLGLDVAVVAASAALVSAIAADGRTATWASGTPPTMAPDTAPQIVAIQRAGYDGAGAAVTKSDTLTITKRLRQPYPHAVVTGGAVSVTDWTAADVVLSDYVYAGDTVPGATNASTIEAPKPLAAWAMEDLRVIGNSLVLDVVAAHRDARDGEEIAAVVFAVSDGTTTLTQTVAASSLITESYDKNAVIGYRATFDVSALGAAITANATVYPHFGGTASVLDGASSTSRHRLATRHFAHKPAKQRRYVYVVEGHANGSAGVVSTSLATAKATPYSSIANALRYGLAAGSADCDGDAVVIGSDITTSAPLTCAINVVTERGDLTIMRDPDVPRSNARILNLAGTPNLFPAAARAVRLRIEDMTVLRGSGSLTTGNATRPLEVALVGCDYDLGTATSPFGSNTTARFIGCTFSAGGAGTFNNVGTLRGCAGSVSGDTVTSSVIIGCAIWGVAYVSTPYLVAYNRFLGIPASTTAFYIGGGGGTAAALIQNVIEPVVQNTNVLRISGDSDTISTSHQVLHYNYVGGNIAANGTTRNNNFYDENTAQARTHELMSLIGNVFIGPCANKGDLFRNDASRLGNWAYSHSVGCHYNVEARVLDAFPKDYRGLGHKVCLNEATPLAIPVVSDLSVSTGGAGGGDYHPATGSPVLNMVRRRALKWDLSGVARSAVAHAAGPYELAA